jgi:hypothetical protein
MEDLIKQAFLHVDVIGPHVHDGHYDLVGPDGEIILPQVWETMIQPDWAITMHMWPMPEPPPPPPPPPGIPGGPLPPPPPPPPPPGVAMAGKVKKPKGSKMPKGMPGPPPPPPPMMHPGPPPPPPPMAGGLPPPPPPPPGIEIVNGGPPPGVMVMGGGSSGSSSRGKKKVQQQSGGLMSWFAGGQPARDKSVKGVKKPEGLSSSTSHTSPSASNSTTAAVKEAGATIARTRSNSVVSVRRASGSHASTYGQHGRVQQIRKSAPNGSAPAGKDQDGCTVM